MTAKSAAGFELKDRVRDFWDRAPCGLVYATGANPSAAYDAHARARYQLEPDILSFAHWEDAKGKDVLEVGVGLGADHAEWARRAPRRLVGVDLTAAAIEHTRARLAAYGLQSELRIADAEALPFPDASFDLVYSWGVLHHSPDTAAAVAEVRRVLRPGGIARVMIYNRRSIVALQLWARYGLMRGRPNRSLTAILAEHLESPGTKGYTRGETLRLFSGFENVRVNTLLGVGDLLLGEAGQRHRGRLLSLARRVWPRWLLRRVAKSYGLTLIVEAVR